MSKKKTSMTAQEIMEKLQANPEYLALEARKNAEFEDKSARMSLEEQPILDDLLSIGWDIASVSDFLNTPKSYEGAIPVLSKHLLLPYSDVIKETLARALAIPESRCIWDLLVKEYINAPMGKGVKFPQDPRYFNLGYKDGLACALAAAVTDETLPEYISLLKDRTHGESRILLLSVLRDSKSSLAKQTLEELEDDPDLKIAILDWNKKQKKK